MNKITNRKKVIIFIGHFYPGYRSGGPARSILNLIDMYKDKIDFYVVCHYADLGEKKQYENIKIDEWNNTGDYKTFYTNISRLRTKKIQSLCKGMDSIFCCGTFNKYAIELAWLSSRKRIKAIFVAPMGNFYPGAFNKKKIKKKLFVFFSRLFHIYKQTIFLFTSNQELMYTKQIFKGSVTNYRIASDVPAVYKKTSIKDCSNKFLFLSRIVPKKGLLDSIHFLDKTEIDDLCFDIYGVIEDQDYWSRCIDALNKTKIKWNYKGPVSPERVPLIFSSYDYFVFLTHGENFGHVIYESLMSGCIPLISNNTPWNLNGSNGVSFPLDQFNLNYIQKLIKDNALKMNIKKQCQKTAEDKYLEIKQGDPFYFLYK